MLPARPCDDALLRRAAAGLDWAMPSSYQLQSVKGNDAANHIYASSGSSGQLSDQESLVFTIGSIGGRWGIVMVTAVPSSGSDSIVRPKELP